MRKACGVEVLLFEIAHCLWIRSFFYSNFEKQNRKGSPTSLIYPYIGKLASFLIKQFFTPKKEHQTLMRSRLRRFCSERCIAADADQKANCFYAAVCTLLSPQNFDVRGKRSLLQPQRLRSARAQDDLLKQKGCYSLCKNAVLIPLFTKKDTAFLSAVSKKRLSQKSNSSF